MEIDLLVDELEQKVEEYLLNHPEATSPHELRMSKSGSCVKRMSQDLWQPKKVPGKTSFLRFRRGHAMHAMWQEIMSEALGDDFCEQETELELELDLGQYGKKKILGHYDGLIKSLDAIYELKNINFYSFESVIKDGAFAADIEQANAYANRRGVRQTLLHYFNVNDCTSLRILVPANKRLYTSTVEKFQLAAIAAIEERNLPRPYNDATASPCWFCHYKGECYKDFKGEVEDYDGVDLTRSPGEELVLKQHIVRCNQFRELRLEHDKNEADEKENIAKIFHARKWAKVLIKEGDKYFETTLKVGSKNNNLVSIKEKKVKV